MLFIKSDFPPQIFKRRILEILLASHQTHTYIWMIHRCKWGSKQSNKGEGAFVMEGGKHVECMFDTKKN